MKNLFKALRKNWIKLWLIVIILAFAGVVSYAAFTRVNVVKRVISTDEGVGDRFSSDYMSAGMKITRAPFYSKTSSPVVNVHVFNYPFPKSAFYRNSEITYKLTARLGTMNGNSFIPLNVSAMSSAAIALLNENGYGIRLNDQTKTFNSTTLTLVFDNCTLDSGTASSNEFNLLFDIRELNSETPNEYYMELIADSTESGLPTLTGYVAVRYVPMASTGWNGTLETLESDKEYDAYNYIVSGTGKGEITFKWDARYVSINKQFLENKNYKFKINGDIVQGSATITEASIPYDANEIYKSITLVVDSSKKSRYEVQFYKTSADDADYEGSIGSYLPTTGAEDWVAYQD